MRSDKSHSQENMGVSQRQPSFNYREVGNNIEGPWGLLSYYTAERPSPQINFEFLDLIPLKEHSSLPTETS